MPPFCALEYAFNFTVRAHQKTIRAQTLFFLKGMV